MDYINRLAEKSVEDSLGFAKAVVIEGPKACGKTSTSMQLANSSIRLDESTALRRQVEANPEVVLSGKKPHLVDEWQLVPDTWNVIRAEVDRNNEFGQYILSGSATPTDDETRHSGAGRFARVKMFPMTSSETGFGTKSISLKSLWEGEKIPSVDFYNNTERDVAEQICRGGWPINLNLSTEQCIMMNKNYIRSVCSADIITVDGVKRDPSKVEALVYSLSRNDASYVSDKTLQSDTKNYGESINPKTLKSYLDALKRIWIYHEQKEWSPSIRSSSTIRKSPKRHLVDPSLAVASLEIGIDDILKDRNTFGILFESLAWRDVSVYAQNSGIELRAYHDSDEAEIDIVLKKAMKWAAIEVKLSSKPDNINFYVTGLQNAVNKIETEPEFMAVLVATGPSYTREDGVHIINLFDLTA
ncbi:MAG: DUF4143 domain-containing protein [Candidatus Ancillula sp.]|jgi:predicted AAA+ superfamily ATPase|nr:DUF4143 domain-containing protein [Candidatus Ancillula sp.]